MGGAGVSPVPVVRTCALRSGSTFASWPADLLDTLCRSYKIHTPKLRTLPEAFQFGSEVEPADFDDALTKAHAENVKPVYDRVTAIPGLWGLFDFIFNTWKTDNQGFVFSVKDIPSRHALRSLLDASPKFARDVPLMQFFHQGEDNWGSRILVPTHQCWREVVNGSPGLHICVTGNSNFDNSVHVDPHQIVVSKKADGTCEYNITSVIEHGWDIRKLFTP